VSEEKKDMLKDSFERQAEFMKLLLEDDKLPEWPIDLTSKHGQRQIKEIVWNLVEELAEASFTLKNRMHRITDHQDLDFEHYKEELGDAFAFFMEICIMSGISAEELHKEYVRKNGIVKQRFHSGY
jgi:NTP pyrophosphatase (non-canonical NTP hydrolase)